MFLERRKKFIEKMNGGIAILRSPDEVVRSHDTHYKYRADSDFYYLTGFSEPDSVLIVAPEHPEHKFILFVRPRDPEKETWNGRRAGVEGAVQNFGADVAFSIDEFEQKLPDYLKNVHTLYYTLGKYSDFDEKIIKALVSIRGKVRQGDYAPETIIDTGSIIHEMRIIKSKEEIDLLKKANKITQEAHIEAMKATKPGMYEFEVEALIENIFKKHGADYPAYASIVGSGVNATILHYVENNKKMEDGELLLIDAGAEFSYYAGDITRSFPVNGKFTTPQKKIYEIVLEAQLEAIKMVKPGNRYVDIHNRALEVLTEGLVKLGLLNGNLEDLIKDEAYKKFYMHRTGHFLGMDVHDAGKYYIEKESRKLEPGMVLTVEPGLYFQENLEGVPSEYLGIGIRIEDDVLVTDNGYEILSDGVPKHIDEIEALMGS